MLAIQKELRKVGLDRFCKKYNCTYKIHGYKVIIKYNLVRTMNYFIHRSVRQTRGIVLHKDTFELISFGMEKFFNYNERNLPKSLTTLSSDNYDVLEKADGSMVCLHYDQFGCYWTISTTGTTDGNGPISKYNKNITFNEMFFDVWNQLDYPSLDSLDKNLIYTFELTTPHNRVVVPYTTSNLKLLTVRQKDGVEYKWSQTKALANALGLNLPIHYSFDKPLNWVVQYAKDLPYTQEGFVIIDENNCRVKVKSSDYINRHHLKGGNQPWHYLDIIKNEETQEYLTMFPDMAHEIESLELDYRIFMDNMITWWNDSIYPTYLKYKDSYDRKSFWEDTSKTMYNDIVFDIKGFQYSTYQNLVVETWNGRISNISHLKEFIYNLDNKKLYNKLRPK